MQFENVQNDVCPQESSSIQELHIGMEFETVEEARKFYKEYGRKEGFCIKIRSSRKSCLRSDQITNVKFCCTNEGIHSGRADGDIVELNKMVRSGSTARTGCKSQMTILYNWTKKKYYVSTLDDTHNHPPISPSSKQYMKSNKHMSAAAKDLTEVFKKVNLPIAKVASLFGGEKVGFDKRDCYNHLRNVRHRDLEVGDAQTVLNFFKRRQVEDPLFFYALQYDESMRAVNFFWVNSRARMSYEQFGDVVAFDTTYKTNRYQMPFAPFTGVNHHYQTIQFGCALLQDETEISFCWLFETWLEAMGGRQPRSFITDQDLAMKAAVPKVFPNTRHRLCLWHIKKKFAEKLSQHYFKKSTFKKQMSQCIHSTFTTADFDKKWKNLVSENGLEDNDWLQNMFDIRDEWVPAYNRMTFFAGMNTTGRSEGINSFFDDYVNPRTTLYEFVMQYDNAVAQLVRNERKEDFESEHKYRIVNENNLLLKHASGIYTRRIYEMFKEEFNEVFHFKVEERDRDGELQTFAVKSVQDVPEEFLVKFNLNTYDGNCGCHLFEFKGLPCKHILKLFVRFDVFELPDNFILKRWRKGANKFWHIDSKGLNASEVHNEALRLSHMCRMSIQLACELSKSEEGYKLFVETLNDISKKMSDIELTVEDEGGNAKLLESNMESVNENQHLEASQSFLLDPNLSQTKSRNKENKNDSTSRIKSGIELAQQKKKRKCKACGDNGHDSRNCPHNAKKRKCKASTRELTCDLDIAEDLDDED